MKGGVKEAEKDTTILWIDTDRHTQRRIINNMYESQGPENLLSNLLGIR